MARTALLPDRVGALVGAVARFALIAESCSVGNCPMRNSVLKKIKALVAPAGSIPNENRASAPVDGGGEAAVIAAGHLAAAKRLHAKGRIEDAILSCEQALGAMPNRADVFRVLGALYWEIGLHLEAAACFLQATKFEPENGDGHDQLAQSLIKLGKLDDAIVSLKKAVELKPDSVWSLALLGNALMEQGKAAEAMVAWRQAIDINPLVSDAFAQFVEWKRKVCDWKDFDAEHDALLKQIRNGSIHFIAYDLLNMASTPRDQLFGARNRVREMALENAPRFPERPVGVRKKLRIGYMSSDFCIHAIAYLTAELFELHDRSRFHVHGYSIGANDGSKIRMRIAKAFDRFAECEPGRQVDPARMIYDDKVDILVDLNGYTSNSDIRTLARRPAPIQVNYLGYPATMGMSTIDYIVADPIVVPREEQKFYAEKVVYLPDCYQVNDSKRPIAPQTPLRSECGLPEEGFVFCCFNRPEKITPAIFEIWMRLLAAVPGSSLWLFERNAMVAENLRREAQARGVDPSRIVFAPRLPLAKHLARHRLADLFLDTLPYNAHTTMSDALWAGLPALTCTGSTFAGRVGTSLLRAIGLPELITTSLPEYEARALALAKSPTELATLRQKLAENRMTTPLFDSRRFTRNIENAYEQMWELHRMGKKPQPIVVTPERS